MYLCLFMHDSMLFPDLPAMQFCYVVELCISELYTYVYIVNRLA